jgi:hypothetical protein
MIWVAPQTTPSQKYEWQRNSLRRSRLRFALVTAVGKAFA